MEQNPHQPSHSPELPSVPEVSERSMESLSPNFEVQSGRTPEGIKPEPQSSVESESMHAASVSLPAVAMPDDTTQPGGQDQSSSASPATASDDDLIEKEWVDKAKKVIEETKDDPYQREQAVKELQADYLFKRYGRGAKAAQ